MSLELRLKPGNGLGDFGSLSMLDLKLERIAYLLMCLSGSVMRPTHTAIRVAKTKGQSIQASRWARPQSVVEPNGSKWLRYRHLYKGEEKVLSLCISVSRTSSGMQAGAINWHFARI
jgi:hypothetical protein